MMIRPATLNDIPLIMRLIAEVVPAMNAGGNFQWDNTYPNAAVFEKDIAAGQLWVADEHGAIAGVAAITTDNEPEYATIGWDVNQPAIVTHRLAVSSKHQGKGIAAALLLQAEQVAETKGINMMRIDTNVVNLATNTLFPKLGYKLMGVIELAFRPGMHFNCFEKEI